MAFFKSKWLSVIIIAGLAWFGLALVRIKIQDNIISKEAGDIESKISGLEEENDSLARFLSHIKNPFFIEKEARIKLNYKAPGEEVVFVYPDETGNPAPGEENFENQMALMPNHLKWFYYLLGY